MSERPAIPSRAELMLQYKKERAKVDSKLISTADGVMRLRELNDVKELENQISHQGDDSGVMSLEAQELRELRTRADVKDGVRRSVNGAIMRLKETLKARWREARATMTVKTAQSVAEEMEKEAQRWFYRGMYWFEEGVKPVNRGRTKQWRTEMAWRGNFANLMSRDLRLRATEALAYQERVKMFAKATGTEQTEAELAMQNAETAYVMSMARTLEKVRGVHDAEIRALRDEGGWLSTHGHLKKDAWRWEAHQVQLQERGRLNAEKIVEEFQAKGIRSPIWYRTVREALNFEPKQDVKAMLEPLRASLDARDKLIEDAQEREKQIVSQTKEWRAPLKNANEWHHNTKALAKMTAKSEA